MKLVEKNHFVAALNQHNIATCAIIHLRSPIPQITLHNFKVKKMYIASSSKRPTKGSCAATNKPRINKKKSMNEFKSKL